MTYEKFAELSVEEQVRIIAKGLNELNAQDDFYLEMIIKDLNEDTAETLIAHLT